jgi:Mg2+-importing ATPase
MAPVPRFGAYTNTPTAQKPSEENNMTMDPRRYTALLSRYWVVAAKLAGGRKTGKLLAADQGPAGEVQKQRQEAIFWLASTPVEDCLAELSTSRVGLSVSEAGNRLRDYGPNEVAHDHKATWYGTLARSFYNPFNVLLSILALMSFLTDDIKATIMLTLMVLLSSLLRFYQEFRSSKAAEKLQAMVTNTVSVRRVDDTRQTAEHDAGEAAISIHARLQDFTEIPLRELVPGDIIRLSAGDMVPADIRLITAKDLFIGQASLTGESFPTEKLAEAPAERPASLFDMPNLCFMGTNVVSGAATAVVISSGGQTVFGRLAQNIAGFREPTEFDKGIHRVSWLLIRFMLVMTPVVFLINGWIKHDWTEAFLFAIAVATGLMPEMLPMIVTGTLAKGAMNMSRHKVIVKRLNAIQSFGAMDVLCSDKTGTLTQDRIVLEKHFDMFGNTDRDVIKHAYLNSCFQTGLKNLLDVAVLQHGDMRHQLNVDRDYKLIDEIPFDFKRKRMSVVVSKEDRVHELICKGAVEEMLSICDRVRVQQSTQPLDEEKRERIQEITRRYNEDGMRVIAVACKQSTGEQLRYGVGDEMNLVLLGFIAFLDPPKETTRPALEALKTNGIAVKILTGDNDIVTRKVCRDVGLDAEHVLIGPDIERMTDSELSAAAEYTTIFAKLTPVQKERIVRALQSSGHVVGFLGDGINDSAALRTADIGISVDSAVDVAKESADIILLEKSLMVLDEGVLEGRKTFGNIVKYIKMAASSNFGNMFSVLGASIFLPFLPMLPLQILTQNLLYDISQTAIPFDEMDAEYMMKPRKWEIGSLARFMLFIGPISSIFDYATFALMWFVFGAVTVEQQSLFQSGWFVEGLLSQTLIVHIIRTAKIPFIQSTATLPLVVMTGIIMAVGIYLPFSPLAAPLKMQPLPGEYFLWLGGILLAYTVLTQTVKSWFVRRYGFN